MLFAPGPLLIRTPPRLGGEEPTTCRSNPKLLGAERSPDRPGEKSHPGDLFPSASPPPRLAVDRGKRTHSSSLAPPTNPRARAAAPVHSRTTLHVAMERPADTRYPRKRATAVKDTRKLPSGKAHPLPFRTSGLREARATEQHAPAAACRHRSPPGSLRLPTESPLQISNESSRSRAAGVMATSDMQGPTPLALSDLLRMLASGTERNRGSNEPTVTLVSSASAKETAAAPPSRPRSKTARFEADSPGLRKKPQSQVARGKGRVPTARP